MCLINETGKFKAKIAEEDIECYKIVFQKCFTNDEFYSFYQHFDYKINEEYNLDYHIRICWYDCDTDCINEGFHSYKYFEDAEKSMWHPQSCILKCIIPKGSTYYEGKYGVNVVSGKDSYVSDKIKLIKIIL